MWGKIVEWHFHQTRGSSCLGLLVEEEDAEDADFLFTPFVADGEELDLDVESWADAHDWFELDKAAAVLEEAEEAADARDWLEEDEMDTVVVALDKDEDEDEHKDKNEETVIWVDEDVETGDTLEVPIAGWAPSWLTEDAKDSANEPKVDITNNEELLKMGGSKRWSISIFCWWSTLFEYRKVLVEYLEQTKYLTNSRYSNIFGTALPV